MELIKNNSMVKKFVEEETITDEKLEDGSVIDLTIIDIGTPVSFFRRGWIDGYLKEKKLMKARSRDRVVQGSFE